MKKFAIIAAMAFSMMAMAACGNNKDKTGNIPGIENQEQEKQEIEDNQETSQGIEMEGEEKTQGENAGSENTDADNKATDTDKNQAEAQKELTDEEIEPQKELTDEEIEAQKKEKEEALKLDLDDRGCFNGTYQGDDGCTYEFTKKGKLTITSDTETIKYEYAIKGNRLDLVMEDLSYGFAKEITFLEEGKYLLEDADGNQVTLTYVK